MKKLILTVSALLLATSVIAADRPCPYRIANDQGTGGDITVDNTAGGVTVLAANNYRCDAVIYNLPTSLSDIRCATVDDVTVDSSTGFTIPIGTSKSMGNGPITEVKCIRTGGSDATVNTDESREQ